MTLKPLPIGIQTFRDVIEGGYLYVDKTQSIYDLIRHPKGILFFARPRRFGKSLLLSALQEVFEGNRDLFRGLWLHDAPYQWEQHPIIRVDFSRNPIQTAVELKQDLQWRFAQIAQAHGIELEGQSYTHQFENLIFQLASHKKVVILIDEYDKPMLDNITDLAEAQRIQETLKRFYTVLKSMDAHIRFVFLTGISKFSKVGVFSGLNNLQDISMDNQYAALCGFTQNELETVFPAYLHELAESDGVETAVLHAQIKQWYNGFCFSRKCVPVYNPFSILLLFQMKEFRNYWFESGTPTFLIKLLKNRNYDVRQLDHLEVNELAFSSYEIDTLQIVPLLFQTGYLTIKGYDPQSRLYTLSYPNFEVEHAFLYYLLGAFGSVDHTISGGYLWKLIRALQSQDLDRFFEVLNIFFADIPYDIQLKQEKYYQTIFYLLFKLMGLEIEAEARTSHGRIDAVVDTPDTLFLFEFKLDGSAEKALAQIQEREYFARYLDRAKPLTLVGVNFSAKTRSVADWQIARLNT
ncbi:MAG: AAA family ATPase [Aquificales bacterium]|nr:AAA family ATPase [Aquificales bacterium]